MGVVYLARQESLDRAVAIKVLRPQIAHSSRAAARFDREAKAVARLRHPNIVTVHTVGEASGVRYIAMELVLGKGLDEIVAESTDNGEPLDVPTVLRWVAELARALDYANELGVVHRDVKPSNIRITPEGRPCGSSSGHRPKHHRGTASASRWKGRTSDPDKTARKWPGTRPAASHGSALEGKR